MEAMKLVSLPSSPASPSIRVEGDRLIIDRLTVADAAVAAFVGERDPEERPVLVERALRIGLTALQEAGVTVNVDHIRREFETLLNQTQATNDRAAHALDELLRLNFADGDGKLPRTLEKFLGDRGQLRTFVADLFDESKRDSAIGRMKTLLGAYFDGDASRLALLLDPTRLNSPLHQFRTEVSDGFARLNDRLTAIEAAAAARGAERAKSSAKGVDFEDTLNDLLGEIARGGGDLVERTGDRQGDVMRSKKGDFVVTLNPSLCQGADLKIVVEAKDRAISGREIRDELREAKTNRAACVALVVFTPAHAPAGIAPFDIRAGDVYCVIDPESPDRATLEAAVRLARLHALATLRERQVDVDAAAIQQALHGIREQLELIRSLKSQLTSINGAASQVNGGLDRLREGVLARVAEAEAELRAVRAEARAG
jgi:ribosomal 50S subunit-associated protein YjgA (DUF615 family)